MLMGLFGAGIDVEIKLGVGQFSHHIDQSYHVRCCAVIGFRTLQ